MAPVIDDAFATAKGNEAWPGCFFSSNWSEHHVAFACGLGTFGLPWGFITEKGMAGRLASVVMDARIEPDERTYTDVYENCIRCGACIRRCPANAITFEDGKDHAKCDVYLAQMGKKFAPRYGCGKCQTGVPCEHANPAA